MRADKTAHSRSRANELTAEPVENRTSSVTLCESLLDRIADRDAELRAWAHLNRDATLRDASAADARRARGQVLSPLDGMPIGIKDNIDTTDFPTEMGSPIHVGRRPTADAEIVRRLKALGLVVLGKTVTTPFGMNAPAPTRNPVEPEHTLGASSVGSAAAVAAGMVPLTVNTQNTSSTTRPASYAGVLAWKPTHGTLPLEGTLALSPPVTHIAFMAGALDDLERLARLLLPAETNLSRSDQPSMAVVKGPWWHRADAETVARFDAFAFDSGISREVAVPPAFEDALEAHSAVIAGDMAVTLAHEYAMHRDLLPEDAVSWIEQGRAMTATQYVTALRLRDTLSDRLALAMDETDVLITLATPGPAPPTSDGLGDGTFSMPWTFCGLPTLSLPLLRSRRGLPIGIQLVARRHCDQVVFAAACRLMAGAHLAKR